MKTVNLLLCRKHKSRAERKRQMIETKVEITKAETGEKITKTAPTY